MTLRRSLIRADGTEEDLPGKLDMKTLTARIGAEIVDVVSLRHLGEPRHVMLVDDNGWETRLVESEAGVTLVPTRPLKPINARATELYLANCRPGTTHQIVGDVVIVPDSDFE